MMIRGTRARTRTEATLAWAEEEVALAEGSLDLAGGEARLA